MDLREHSKWVSAADAVDPLTRIVDPDLSSMQNKGIHQELD